MRNVFPLFGMVQLSTGGAVVMPDKLIVLLVTEEDFKEKIKKIVTDKALYHEPTEKVVEGIWNLLLSLNNNKEET